MAGHVVNVEDMIASAKDVVAAVNAAQKIGVLSANSGRGSMENVAQCVQDVIRLDAHAQQLQDHQSSGHREHLETESSQIP
jgi:2-methylisocitrate lyase-like PEP mutase family enzyme